MHVFHQDRENAEREAMAVDGKRVKVTITAYIDLNRENYKYSGPGSTQLSSEKLNKLTPTDMLEIERTNLTEGEYGLNDLCDDVDIENDVTMELVDSE